MGLNQASPIIGSLLFVLLVISPLPFSFFFASYFRDGGLGKPVYASSIIHDVLLMWCLQHMLIGHFLGCFSQFALKPLLIAEIGLLVVGTTILLRMPQIKVQATSFNITELLLISVLGGIFASAFIRGLVAMPAMYDSYGYHLPEIGRWIVSKNFLMWPTLRNWWGAYIAYGWEVVSGVFMLTFKSDYLSTLPNLAALALLAIATYRTGRILGAARIVTLWGTALLSTVPFVLRTVNGVMVDVPLAASFMSAVTYGFELKLLDKWRLLPAFLLSLGIVASVKTTGIGYAVLAIFVMLFGLSKKSLAAARNEIFQRPYAILIAILVALFLVVFWPVRNFVSTGVFFLAGHSTLIRPIQSFNVTGVWVAFKGTMEGVGLLITGLCFLVFLGTRSEKNGGRGLVTRISDFAGYSDNKSLDGKNLGGRKHWVVLLIFGAFLLYLSTPLVFQMPSVVDWWFTEGTRYGFAFYALLTIAAAVIAGKTFSQKQMWVGTVIILICLAGQFYIWLVLRLVPYRDFHSQLKVVVPYALIVGLAAVLIFMVILRVSSNNLHLTVVHCVFASLIAGVLVFSCYSLREKARQNWLGGIQVEVSRRFQTLKAFWLAGDWPYTVMGISFDSQVFSIDGEQRFEFGSPFSGSLPDLLEAMERHNVEFGIVGSLRFDRVPRAVTEGLESGKLRVVWEAKEGSTNKTTSVAMIFRRELTPNLSKR